MTDYAAYGALGGRTKAANRAATVDALRADLPALDCVEHAKLRLAAIQDIALANGLPGSVLGAAVRAVEVWLKAEAHETDRNRIRALESQIAALEDELKSARASR